MLSPRAKIYAPLSRVVGIDMSMKSLKGWRSPLAAFFFVVGTSVAPPVLAESVMDASILAGSCFNCHGTDGRSNGAIPSIAGRPQLALKNQLMAYKSEQPPVGTTVMTRIAKGYSDKEIDALALYFSQVNQQASVIQKDLKK